MREIDACMEGHDCNHADKLYVLQQMLAKMNIEIQQQRTQDMMGKINPRELIKNIMGKKE
jgi:hypothetical protein